MTRPLTSKAVTQLERRALIVAACCGPQQMDTNPQVRAYANQLLSAAWKELSEC